MADILTAERLCALTGLTDRRHRQIAAEGYFPHPTNGEYQAGPTIAGMFRYYREAYQKTSRTLAEDKRTKLQREIELLDLKIAEQNSELVPMAEVDRVWKSVCIAVRQILQGADIPSRLKDELVAQFQKVNVGDYYKTTGAADTESEPVTTPD